MADRWSWETPGSDWGVDFDRATGKLAWWGADKPSSSVPPFAQGGGGMDQWAAELVAARRGPYDCPAEILAEVIAASEAWVAERPVN